MSKAPIWQQLAMGGTSVVPAVVVTHPLDTIKLRMQLQGMRPSGDVGKYHGMVSGLATIGREEGAARLLRGLSPALCRAFTYSAVRIGMYEPIRHMLTEKSGAEEPTFMIKLASGLTSGALGAFVGNPFELLKVRMQGKDHAYRGVLDGMYKIVRTEGWTNLWNGANAAMLRASLFCASQLATYDHTKVFLKRHIGLKDGVQVNFGAAMTAGLITTTVSTPADFVKSVMMNSKERTSPMKVALDVIQRDGGRGFFRGWCANYARLGPHTVITIITYEKVRDLAGLKSL